MVVSDDAGRTIAIGDLMQGTVEAEISDYGECVFYFEVDDVPGDLAFYEVEVTSRGGLTCSRDELDDELSLTLG